MNRFARFASLAVSASLLALAFGASAQTIGIAGTKRGFTSQASAAIAKVVSEKTGVQMRAQTFGGSSVYVPQVSAGTMEFGLANELETEFAATGTGIYKGREQPNLQAAAVLIPFRVATFVRSDSDIKSLADLKGKRVPGGWTSQKIIDVLMRGQLANAGLTYDDVETVPVANVVAGANDFAAGKADAFFFVFGAGKVKETNAKVGGLRVLPIDGSKAAVDRMRRHVPPAYAFTVEPSTRNIGVDKPLAVMAYDYLLLTNASVSDDIVYEVVKTLHKEKQALAAAFPALNGLKPARLAKSLPHVDYHAGAIRYLTEIGQWPPN